VSPRRAFVSFGVHPMNGFISKAAIKGARSLRALWMLVGVTVLIVLLVEIAFRIKQQLSGELVNNPPVPASYAGTDWYAGYLAEYDAARGLRWEPIVYFGRYPSFTGKYINIDSLGRRITPQPTVPTVPAARVFFFGGSTMWGTSQRDEHTIPAEAARRLQPLAGPGRRIEVLNLGENGYVFTQEVLALLLELRSGNIPDVVVFLDGINDVFGTVQSGVAGYPQNEMKRSADFQLGRQLTPLIPADSGARLTSRAYAATTRVVEALAQEYGFVPIYVWQPTIHSTSKPLAPFEQSVMNGILRNPTQLRMREVHLATPSMLDSLLKPVLGPRFVNASGLFARDSSEVYTDRVGHNTERSIPTIIDAFWPPLHAAVTNRIAK
jgi:lysophospholipase L1-like esterase